MTIVADNPLFTEEVPEKGAAKGHVRFALKQRTPEDIALAGFCANVAASLLFERMQAQGTNLIIDLTNDSARIDVLARYEEDGLNLQWTPKPAEPSALDAVQERIRNKTFFIGKEEKPKGADKNDGTSGGNEGAVEKPGAKVGEQNGESTPRTAPSAEDMLSDEEEDYLVKQLHRIP